MKRSSWRALAVCLLASMPAAVSAGGGVTFGGGLNLSSIEPNAPFPGTDRVHPGFNLGVGLEQDASRYFSFALELNLESRGVEGWYESPLVGEVDLKYSLLYAQIPLLAIAKLPIGRGAIGLYGGLSAGVNLSSKAESEGPGGSSASRDMKDDTHAFEAGVEWGLTFEIPAGEGRVFLRPGYHIGLTQVYDQAGEAKAVELRLRAGYRMPF